MKQRSQSVSSFGSLPTENEKAGGSKKLRRVPEDQVGHQDGSKLDRVRELLFGEQVAEHSRSLSDLESRLEARLAALEAEATELEQRFEARLAAATGAIAEEIRGEIAALSRRLDDQGVHKLERSEFRSMLSDLAKRVGD